MVDANTIRLEPLRECPQRGLKRADWRSEGGRASGAAQFEKMAGGAEVGCIAVSRVAVSGMQEVAAKQERRQQRGGMVQAVQGALYLKDGAGKFCSSPSSAMKTPWEWPLRPLPRPSRPRPRPRPSPRPRPRPRDWLEPGLACCGRAALLRPSFSSWVAIRENLSRSSSRSKTLPPLSWSLWAAETGLSWNLCPQQGHSEGRFGSLQ